MPLCPQITNTPVTVTQTADFTVSSVLPVVAATTTQVDQAQSTAASALADAAVAYNAAVNSLQPSAYAIQNPTTKQLSAIDATGLTVYVNSPTTGPRVVLNSLGLAGFNAFGSATFSISASTGAAVFSGSVTGSTITGGTLNIAGNAIIDASGLLTATGATITGTINATAGYIGSAANGWNFSSSGFLTNSAGTTILYPSSATGAYALISDRAISGSKLQATSTATDSIAISGGGNVAGTLIINREEIAVTTQIYGGYGVISHWSPNVDNTYTCGMSGRKWQAIWSNTGTIQTSDSRLKINVQDSRLGLDFVNSLRPVSYRWIEGEKQIVKNADGNPVIIETDKLGKPVFQTQSIAGKRTHWGFISQEVKDAVDRTGVEDFAGWVLDDVSDPDSNQGLRYEQFIAPLVKAVQELTARITALEAQLTTNS